MPYYTTKAIEIEGEIIEGPREVANPKEMEIITMLTVAVKKYKRYGGPPIPSDRQKVEVRNALGMETFYDFSLGDLIGIRGRIVEREYKTKTGWHTYKLVMADGITRLQKEEPEENAQLSMFDTSIL